MGNSCFSRGTFLYTHYASLLLYRQRHENIQHSLAGAGAGVVSSVVTCPLDVVKTRLQNQGKAEAGVTPYRGTIGKNLDPSTS